MLNDPPRQYLFGDFILEVAERRLLRMKIDRVELAGKPFDLLVYLVEHPGELLSRDTLIEAVWGETNVSDQSLTEAISRIRRALDRDSPERFIQTIAGRGYRFLGKVEAPPIPLRVIASDQDSRAASTPLRRYLIPILATIGVAVIPMIALRSWKHPARDSRSLYEQALRSERTGDDGLAVQELKQVLTLDPNNAPAKLRIAWILYQDNQNEEAAGFVQVSAKTGQDVRPPDAVQFKGLALRAMLAGNLEDAQQQLKLALEADPNNVETLEFLAENEINRQQLNQALAHVSRCLELDRGNPFCYFQNLEILVRQDDFDGALTTYTTAMKRTQNYPWLHEQAAYAELGLGKRDQASREFGVLREAGQKLANAVYVRAALEGLAQVYLIQEQYGLARRMFEDAISRSSSTSDNSVYHLFVAGMEALQDHSAETENQVKVACSTFICDADDLNMAARVLVLARDFDGGRAHLQALKTGPLSNSDELVATGRFLEGSEALFVRHDFAAAVSLLMEAHEADSDPVISYVLAKAQKEGGDLSGAQQSLRLLLDNKGNVFLDSFACLIPMAQRELRH
jgi:DNA-binding winged helix-turn-helix (wHTH) protein/Flp pilus assembly protein TadD